MKGNIVIIHSLLLLGLASLQKTMDSSSVAFAFQKCLYPRHRYCPAGLGKTTKQNNIRSPITWVNYKVDKSNLEVRRNAFGVIRFIKRIRNPISWVQYRLEKSKLKVAGSVGDGSERENESLMHRIKKHIKSYQDNDDNSKRTRLRRMETYVKYPFRFVRNYFRGEKQEEIDAFNDVIVSDEVAENAQDYLRESLLSQFTIADEKTTDKSLTVEGPLSSTVSLSTIPIPETVTDRSDVSKRGVDLSGKWNIVATDDFKQSYDKYLTLLGQSLLIRSVALSIVGLTTEETIQSDDGRALFIRGQNARGVWERTLVASTAENAIRTPIVTVDAEKVEAEAWWEGPVHRSWIRGVQKYGGGDFESKRYLEDDGKIIVCETVFHPRDLAREKARITWRFVKQQ